MRRLWKKMGKRMTVLFLAAVLLTENLCFTYLNGAMARAAGGNQEREDTYAWLDDLKTETVEPVEPIREIHEDNQPSVMGPGLDSAGNSFAQTALEFVEKASKKVAETLPEMKGFANIGGKILSVIGGVFNALTIVSDMMEMENLNNQNEFWRAMEGLALLADAILAILSILAAIGLIGGGWLLALLAFIVGIIAAILHSVEFADKWGGGRIKPPDGVNALKPNIYIYYADSGTPVQVRFTYPRLLTTSIPDYSGGWDVTSLGDGQIVEKDGNVYDYLFYESMTSKGLFQRNEGYQIPAEKREESFHKILGNMGFNEQEISDFTDFWSRRLSAGVDYRMYPQSTERVDLAMPMTVTPKPEHIERIWFVFEKEDGQHLQEPDPFVMERDMQKTVIEWGGMVFGE
ncbi:MAG: hypothetical protein HFG41_02430 [Coprococcus sp.]|nr:hypothetical protein [Coprococcus sp.]